MAEQENSLQTRAAVFLRTRQSCNNGGAARADIPEMHDRSDEDSEAS